MRKRIKTVFVGPQEIAGFLTRISESLADHGVEVTAFKQHVTEMQPKTPNDSRVKWIYKDEITHLSKKSSLINKLRIFSIKLRVVFYVIFNIDSCLYLGGKGLFGFPIEYYLYRLLGIRVVHMFVGSASRPRYLSSNAKHVINGSTQSVKKLASRIVRQSRRVRNFSHAASLVIENPLCGHFHKDPFVNYFKLGIPIDKNSFPPSFSKEGQSIGKDFESIGKIRILHCPSKPEIKGTEKIKRVLNPETLRELNAELIIKTGVSRETIISELEKCDFVIDQLYSDTPLAGFAAEAAFFGKMPIVGGYGWQCIQSIMETNELPPTTMCHPDNLHDTVRSLCTQNDHGRRRATEIQNFMESGNWSTSEFAKKMLSILSGDIEKSWIFDPKLTTYKNGVGLAEEESKAIISKLINTCGLHSLRLKHIPQLEKDFCEWV